MMSFFSPFALLIIEIQSFLIIEKSLMLLLLTCILFNSYISIVFKLFAKYEIRVLQAIVINYFVCALTASVIMGKPAVTLEVFDKDWFVAALLIGLNFIVTFNLFALTVQKFGVVLGSIFQKMSLIAPTLAAILYYGDSAGPLKVTGILLAVASIFIISLSGSTDEQLLENGHPSKKINPLIWLFPIGTFLGSCLVDGGLWYVNQTGLASSLDIDFIATLFFFAGSFGLLFVLFDYFKNRTAIRKKDIIAGFALGIPNFFSIWLLLKVLANGMEASVVFPIINVGILVTTAILGLILFGEKFKFQKTIGFLMAVAAIILIATG
ncbi:MAG: drug/metabolite transporter (DMT)-like permease [Saprospiraceae bacterium]|jgi:drug/metabolite transporter (DMT)-like permease